MSVAGEAGEWEGGGGAAVDDLVAGTQRLADLAFDGRDHALGDARRREPVFQIGLSGCG